MRSETLPEIPTEDNFSLNFYMPLVLKISFVIVNESPFLDSLNHFSPISHFYTPWKSQKTYDFQTFSRV